jgi:hypothetical protein
MSSVRLSSESLQKFKDVLSVYRDETSKDKWSSGETGKKRLETVNNKLLAFESADEINREAFLKDMAAFAYNAYIASWTQASDSLSAQMLKFVAEELKMKKIVRQDRYSISYAPLVFTADVESDTAFFTRVNEAVNPRSPAVKKFLGSTQAIMFSYAGVSATEAQLAAKAAADARDTERSYYGYGYGFPR